MFNAIMGHGRIFQNTVEVGTAELTGGRANVGEELLSQYAYRAGSAVGGAYKVTRKALFTLSEIRATKNDFAPDGAARGSGTICTPRPTGRSDKWCLTP